MSKLSEKLRKGLRRFFIVLGVSAASLIIAACYGMPVNEDESENENSTEENIKAEINEKDN